MKTAAETTSQADGYRTVPHLFAILRRRDLAPFPLQPPVTLLINALINVDLATCKEDSFPPSDPLVNITRLVEILDKSTDLKFIKLGAKAAENFDENGAPLIALFRKIIETGGEDVMAYLKSRLIPSEK